MIVAGARLALSAVASIFFAVAGHHMRAQGSGVNFSFGLLAYGAAFAVLAYGIGGMQGYLDRNDD